MTTNDWWPLKSSWHGPARGALHNVFNARDHARSVPEPRGVDHILSNVDVDQGRSGDYYWLCRFTRCEGGPAGFYSHRCHRGSCKPIIDVVDLVSAEGR